MVLKEVYNTTEIQRLEDIGIRIENKDYNKSECRLIENQIEEYIINKSTKGGEISKLSNEFHNILNKLIKFQSL